MWRSLILILVIVAFGYKSIAQQDPHFSQYMFAKSYWSPALTALDGKGSVSVISRAQWVGYEPTIENDGGAPSTQYLNFSTPVSLKKIPLGVGINVLYDKVGPINTIETQVSLAYHKRLNRGTISFGIRPELINRTLSGDQLRFVDGSDPFNSQKQESQMVIDLAFGVGYSTEEFILAAGVNHLLQPEMNYSLSGTGDADNKTSMIYNLYGEYNYRLTYNVDLTPSILVTSDINTFSIDLSVIATYNQKLWGGLSYRNNEALTLLMGYSFLENNQLKAGYSFDYIIKEQSAKQPTSHEIFIRYDLPSISTGAKKIIRTPRFRY
ncbi:type IX secretion system membrane protein PorP/SprF [Reichenbachiella carrageenanivorans]|uniref:Type IX secretion system membrane protein PorP/SprF n=1 Tax=Reichenbachiella carrageenanivorans TaxID=2979869 RepID=A0ABY6D1X4_9BACT|nr:type IX secretion system membrane protein PorP/SprF [Reichenbachiella carrageenanivorans]UXX80156.1 type IX secretion system membrane protein PorP/SprF [Reichenbachiella carrageenanivorans]